MGLAAKLGQMLEVFYPVSLHGTPDFSAVGLGEVELIEGRGGEQLMRAQANGSEWDLLAEPGAECTRGYGFGSDGVFRPGLDPMVFE